MKKKRAHASGKTGPAFAAPEAAIVLKMSREQAALVLESVQRNQYTTHSVAEAEKYRALQLIADGLTAGLAKANAS